MASPTRVAIIGLKPFGNTLSNWGPASHLTPLAASPHYEIVALCNSTVESARESIQSHKLPASTKAYGNPEDVANDPDVDLVVVSVVVGKHFMLANPQLLKKKNVLVEWPLGASSAEAKEMASLAKANNLKTVVGLQLRADPMIRKVRELLDQGKIGRITGSFALGCSSVLPTEMWPGSADYYLDMKSGGNEFTIFFGHFLDTFTHVLGDFAKLQSTLKTQYPNIPVIDLQTGQTIRTTGTKTSPDHIMVQGELESGAVASISYRKTPKPVDGLALHWLITGSEGEIEITVPEEHVQSGPAGRAIRLRVGKEEVQDIAFEDTAEPDYVKGVPFPGTNSARMYEQFATGGKNYASFDDALKTHRLLDRIVQEAHFL